MRCGTSFLLIVMIIAVFVFAPIGRPALHWLILSRVLGIALVAGLAYEVIRWAGRNRRKRWVRGLMWPGLQLQKLTTREPSLDQLAVAIAALEGGARGREPRRVHGGGPARHGSRRLTRGDMAEGSVIERLVEQIEQRYRELERAARRSGDDRRPRALHRGLRGSHRELERAARARRGVPPGAERRGRRGGAARGRRRRARRRTTAGSFRRSSPPRARRWRSSARSFASRWWSATRTTPRT